MGITYNKQFTSKDRRILPNGPADRQHKQAVSAISSSLDQSLVSELREHIVTLKKQLNNKKAGEGLYTTEQVNAEIIKAIKDETSELRAKNSTYEAKNKEILTTHEKEINVLKNIIKEKDVLIDEIRANKSYSIDESKLAEMIAESTKNAAVGILSTVEPDRPKIGAAFIDPIEKDVKVEKHFKIEDISIRKKDDVNDKVAKLKALIGKTP